MDHEIRGTRTIIDIKRLIPGGTTVLRFKDATLLIRAEDIT